MGNTTHHLRADRPSCLIPWKHWLKRKAIRPTLFDVGGANGRRKFCPSQGLDFLSGCIFPFVLMDIALTGFVIMRVGNLHERLLIEPDVTIFSRGLPNCYPLPALFG